MAEIRKTMSVCPVCLKRIPASILEEDGKIFIEKECKEHGKVKEVYWSDAALYKKFESFNENGVHVTNPSVEVKKGCPWDCGLCDAHESQTLLGLIDVTNRCNLKCHYCFANAAVAGYIYEPSFDEVLGMLDNLRAQKPLPVLGVMFSGGEPLVREDFVDIVKETWARGFTQILVATNGIMLVKKPGLAKQLQEAGVATLYMKFNGTTPDTNIENHEYMEQIIEECRKAGLMVTLVPTIIKGFNDHQIGDIVKFAADNIDVVRGVNFQPISFCGQMSDTEKEAQRITIPDLFDLLDEQTGGAINKGTCLPVPCMVPFSKLAKRMTGREQFRLSAHPHCGAGSYLFKTKEGLVSITEFLDVEQFLKDLDEVSEGEGEMGKLEKLALLNKVRKIVKKNVIKEKVPNKLPIEMLLVNILLAKAEFLPKFHMQTLFVGTMHFQDPYNLDMARLRKCVIHYAAPDGRIIPFCAYNNLGYRDEIEKKFAKHVNREMMEKKGPNAADLKAEAEKAAGAVSEKEAEKA